MAAERKQLRYKAAIPLCGLAVGAAMALAGCSLPFGDLPSPVGLPAGTPDRPADPAAYPDVHGAQPTRSERVLTEEERAKLEQDLAAARQRQSGGSAGANSGASSSATSSAAR